MPVTAAGRYSPWEPKQRRTPTTAPGILNVRRRRVGSDGIVEAVVYQVSPEVDYPQVE